LFVVTVPGDVGEGFIKGELKLMDCGFGKRLACCPKKTIQAPSRFRVVL
jgi:hypothetical protein